MIGSYVKSDSFNHYRTNLWAAETKKAFYGGIKSFAHKHTTLARFSGLGIGLSSSLISVGFRIGRVGEVISRSADDLRHGHILRATGRLVFKGTGSLVRLAFSPLDAAIKTTASTIGYLISPRACADNCELAYTRHVRALKNSAAQPDMQ